MSKDSEGKSCWNCAKRLGLRAQILDEQVAKLLAADFKGKLGDGANKF